MASIFTKIINREIPAKIVHEDETCIAFHDLTPQAPVHILITPKKEIPSLADLSEGDEKILGHLLATASLLAKQFKIDKSGYRVVINTNEDAGQTVFHIHLHLIGGRPLEWPPG
jgi:histidine triad (HIT) family protein